MVRLLDWRNIPIFPTVFDAACKTLEKSSIRLSNASLHCYVLLVDVIPKAISIRGIQTLQNCIFLLGEYLTADD